MRALFGIAELQSMMASAMQAARRSGVSSSWATATVDSALVSKTATVSTPMQTLIMLVSLRRELALLIATDAALVPQAGSGKL
jgi:hypothetical protein